MLPSSLSISGRQAVEPASPHHSCASAPLLQVKPYHFDYCCGVRQRWLGQSIIDIFMRVRLGPDRRVRASVVGHASHVGEGQMLIASLPSNWPSIYAATTGVPRSWPRLLRAGPGRRPPASGGLPGAPGVEPARALLCVGAPAAAAAAACGSVCP